MEFKSYQDCAWMTDRTREDHRALHMAIGFVDESSHVCGLVKAARREQVFNENVKLRPEILAEEIGDSLWYLAAVHSVRGKDLGTGLPFDDFTGLDAQARHLPQMVATKNLMMSISDCSQGLLHGKNFPQKKANQHLYALADFACTFGTNLNTCAEYNLNKVHGRYTPSQPEWPQLSLSELGQMSFDIKRDNDKVILNVAGQPFGDPLTSQMIISDDFEWHDAIHFSFGTHLGWSPVIRALSKTKRKAEFDGLRHQQLEEVLIQKIWQRKQENRSNYVDWDLLSQIKRDTSNHPEANQISFMQWEKAIRNGLDICDALIARGYGRLNCDFQNHTMALTA